MKLIAHPSFPGVYLNANGTYESFFFEVKTRKKIITATNEPIAELAAFELSLKLDEHSKMFPGMVTTYKLKQQQVAVKKRKKKQKNE